MTRLSALFATLIIATLPATAFAGNDDDVLIGTQGARLGGAVTATVTDSTALWYNPGAIGRTRWAQFGASGTAVRTTLTHRDDSNRVDVAVIPSTLGHEIPLPNGWAFGYGIFTSQATPTMADTNRATYNFGAGVGAPLGSTLRIGAGVFAVYETRTVLRALSSFASLGLHWAPTTRLNLGLSVNSPRMLLVSAGNDGTEPLDPGFSASAPLRVRGGIAYDFGTLVVSLDGDVQPALRNTDARIDRRLVPNARVGFDYKFDEQTRLGLGLFTDLSAERSGQPRMDFFGVAGGIETSTRYQLDPAEPADAVEISAFLGFRYALGLSDFRYALPSGRVTSTTTVHEIGINLGSALRF